MPRVTIIRTNMNVNDFEFENESLDDLLGSSEPTSTEQTNDQDVIDDVPGWEDYNAYSENGDD